MSRDPAKQPNPDDEYALKAASEPVAPAMLWLFPRLKAIEPSKQKAAMAEASRKARRHWLSALFQSLLTALVTLGVWAAWTDRIGDYGWIRYLILFLLIASLLHDYVRTRSLLRNA
jgi:hypothetical protein